MRSSVRFVSATAVVIALVAVPGSAQKTTGPKAHYEMDVETTSGIGAMSFDMGSMLFGGGPKMDGTAYRLELRLGSSIAPAKQPEKADQFIPANMKLGKSIPLLGDVDATTPYKPGEDGERAPDKISEPRGRLLLYWGCGAKAPKGQPLILDFSKLAKGQVPPNLYTVNVPTEKRLMPNDFANFAYWPRGGKDSKQPKPPSSLLGEHRIAGNFNPEIKFNLAQDYMGGLNLKDSAQTDGSILLSWANLAPATGYVAWAMGGKDQPGQESAKDMVWWTSSSTRDFGGGLWDWLPPETVAKLVQKKMVMAPGTTTCQIPAEVKTAASGFLFGNMTAFGPEAHFSFPPKPADAKAVWNIDWTARVRYRSTSMLMMGMGDMMGGMGGNAGAGDAPKDKPKEKTCKGPFGVKIPCL